jgi:hypothetical protein
MKKLTSFGESIKSYASPMYQVECSICGNTTTSSANFGYGDEKSEFDEFSRELYSDGWRVSNSKTYGHFGLHCGNCHKNRNNPE